MPGERDVAKTQRVFAWVAHPSTIARIITAQLLAAAVWITAPRPSINGDTHKLPLGGRAECLAVMQRSPPTQLPSITCIRSNTRTQ